MMSFSPVYNFRSVKSVLSRIAIFGGLDDTQLKVILSRVRHGLFKTHEVIFDKGDEPDYIYIVKKGKISLLISGDNVTVKKKILKPGDCFGLASLIAIHKHTATATAIEKGEILVLSRRALIEIHKVDIKLFALLMMNIARELARRLQLTDNILLHYLANKD
ncbi:MAG: cyclic nucleotide-binding domain-containing protein [Deltaproteobacteria bacterium]|nr:cyclic nucleotide-binding domain-containing protein [Deltaproteobacteria bacterium]